MRSFFVMRHLYRLKWYICLASLCMDNKKDTCDNESGLWAHNLVALMGSIFQRVWMAYFVITQRKRESSFKWTLRNLCIWHRSWPSKWRSLLIIFKACMKLHPICFIVSILWAINDHNLYVSSPLAIDVWLYVEWLTKSEHIVQYLVNTCLQGV